MSGSSHPRPGQMALFAAAVAALTSAAMVQGAPARTVSAGNEAMDRAAALAAYARLPLVFEANAGQAPGPARYLARGPGYRLLLQPDAALLQLYAGSEARESTLRLRFVDADPAAEIRAESPRPGRSNYFAGGEEALQIADVEQFARVRYAGLYPGVDLVYYGEKQELEFDLVLAPGADPGRIGLRFDGARTVEIGEDGEIILHTAAGELRQHPPKVYQPSAAGPRAVAARYVTRADGAIGFALSAYDAAQPLVIDPVLSYSKVLGDFSDGTVTALAVDADGNAYVAGSTRGHIPVVHGDDHHPDGHDTDMFVAKLDPTGRTLLYSSYLGGSHGDDRATGIAVDNAGNLYLTGTTSGGDFPVTAQPYQQATAEGAGVVAKLNPAGNKLVYATYLRQASPGAIAVDAAGNAYLTGAARPGFATSAGAVQGTSPNPGGTSPFVMKLAASGARALYATFLGGHGNDQANAIAVDPVGGAYVAGTALSGDFPATNAFQARPAGGEEAFVARLTPAGALAYATYLGGSGNDRAFGIAVDRMGAAYVAGETFSDDFPVRNAPQANKPGKGQGGFGSAFVTKLVPSGAALAYSTYLGGEPCAGSCRGERDAHRAGDAARAIAVDEIGQASVAGSADSYGFPLVSALATGDDPGGLFLARLAAGGGALVDSTLLAGKGAAGQVSLALDPAGGACLLSGGPSEAARLRKLGHGGVSVALASAAELATADQPLLLTARVAGGGDGKITFLEGNRVLAEAPVSGGMASASVTLATGFHPLVAIYRGATMEAGSAVLTQAVGPTAAQCQ